MPESESEFMNTDVSLPPFIHHQVSYSFREADDLARALSNRYSAVKIEPFGKKRLVAMKSSAGLFNGIKINASDFSYGLNIIPETQYDAIFFIFPMSGLVESQEERGLISATKGAAIASEGATCRRLGFSPGHVQLGMTIDRTFLRERLAILLEQSLPPDILFEPVLEPSSGRYEAAKAFVMCLNTKEFGQALASSPRTASRMPPTIADFMLENWRHNYSHLLDQKPPLVTPKHVKMALGLIEEETGMLASVEELSKLCGVSLRALQYGFKHFVGTSITEHQRGVRLERARRDLLTTPDPIETIAQRWGFSNASRFSRYFKYRYGIFPSHVDRR